MDKGNHMCASIHGPMFTQTRDYRPEFIRRGHNSLKDCDTNTHVMRWYVMRGVQRMWTLIWNFCNRKIGLIIPQVSRPVLFNSYPQVTLLFKFEFVY